jgi:hypothetical protein
MVAKTGLDYFLAFTFVNYESKNCLALFWYTLVFFHKIASTLWNMHRLLMEQEIKDDLQDENLRFQQIMKVC